MGLKYLLIQAIVIMPEIRVQNLLNKTYAIDLSIAI